MTLDWPLVILILGIALLAVFLVIGVLATWHEFTKTRVEAQQENDVRQLVNRYEQLAETILDAQQRTAADLAELRVRTVAIEQILRTVE